MIRLCALRANGSARSGNDCGADDAAGPRAGPGPSRVRGSEMPVRIRKNVWDLGDDWAEPILWYARAIAELKTRALDDPTSWRFYGAIHGFHQRLWELQGYYTAGEGLPSRSLRDQYWDQCQHGSWYFLPWHRGYLLGLEACLRAVVEDQGGPSDWALPYWNYFTAGQNALPPAFATPDWPDGQGDNPLYVPQRYGPDNTGDVYVPVDQINLKALSDPDFTGTSGGSPGFGGVDTGFSHGGRIHGGIETQPHDWVHVLVGGEDTASGLPGLMSTPPTAGLDPIFWLHHANIDRLWEVWRQNPPSHVDPTESNWLEGPGLVGERTFQMPKPDGSAWVYTPAEMSDLSSLGYEYDDTWLPDEAPTPAIRLARLGLRSDMFAAAEGRPMGGPKTVELMGANEQPLRLTGDEARATVAVDATPRRRVQESFAAAPGGAGPDRVFLNLENVRASKDTVAFSVYVAPRGDRPAASGEQRGRLAGSVALFGAGQATEPDGEHAGDGLTYVLEITDIIDDMHLAGELDASQLDVRLVPVRPVSDDANVSVGRISIFRQSE